MHVSLIHSLWQSLEQRQALAVLILQYIQLHMTHELQLGILLMQDTVSAHKHLRGLLLLVSREV